MNYNFILISISGSKNPANKPSHSSNYAQDIPIPTDSIILQDALHLLPLFLNKYLFSLIIFKYSVEIT